MKADSAPTPCSTGLSSLPVGRSPPRTAASRVPRSATSSSSYRLSQPWPSTGRGMPFAPNNFLLIFFFLAIFFFSAESYWRLDSRTGCPVPPARLMRSGITRKWRRKRSGSSFKFVRANPAAQGHAGNAGCLPSCQYRLGTPLAGRHGGACAHPPPRTLLAPSPAACLAHAQCRARSPFSLLFLARGSLASVLARACGACARPWRVFRRWASESTGDAVGGHACSPPFEVNQGRSCLGRTKNLLDTGTPL